MVKAIVDTTWLVGLQFVLNVAESCSIWGNGGDNRQWERCILKLDCEEELW